MTVATTPGKASTTLLAVPSMCCAAEFGAVEKELQRVDGVRVIAPDFIRRLVRVEHDAVPEADLVAAASRSGFSAHLNRPVSPVKGRSLAGISVRAEPMLGATSAAASSPTGQHSAVAEVAADDATTDTTPTPASVPIWKVYWKLAIATVCALSAEAIALVTGEHSIGVITLSVLAIALAGLNTYRKGIQALWRFNLNINALMSVAVTGAALIGQWPEAAMVMVLFTLAELIEHKSLDRARRAVEGLMAMAPDVATVQSNQGWRKVAASEVEVGSLVRVRPGERVALDGTVVEGHSAIDQSAITGESVPVDKAPGDRLFAGTLNQNGELQFRVTSEASHSTLARIIQAVQEAQSTRAPTQRFVDSFSRIYTPVVFAIAIALAVLPPLLMDADAFTWIYRALVLLVIACPCALVLSTPISVVSGMTAAARRGILVKGGVYMEQAHRLRVLALDKTGTLTQGKPVVTDVVVLQGTRDDSLELAVALSERSDHPISRAMAALRDENMFSPEVSGFKALQGMGIEGSIAGTRYRLGNQKLTAESQALLGDHEQTVLALEREGKTVVLLLREQTVLCVFAVADQVRAQSADAVAELKRLGIRPVMLTGDNRFTAEAIARQVGIEDVRSELLPAQKLQAIETLAADGTVVGMVGDGINDAPALARSHIGFAMAAAGTDTAIETADVALMDDDPRKLAEFVRLSRSTKTVLWQNIVFALGLKVVFLALAVNGQATLWMAVFADMGGSLLVVANGLRLLRMGTVK